MRALKGLISGLAVITVKKSSMNLQVSHEKELGGAWVTSNLGFRVLGFRV